ncbi:MAG TPA: glycosyltransferase [Blastocatellia bacterium]|nr:glycosyltransferase [Blastocatellia bacterium]
MNNIHIWIPDLFSFTGGIQAFSRYLINAVQDGPLASPVRGIIKSDRPSDIPDGAETENFSGCGHWPARLRSPRFAVECLRHVWRERPNLIVSTHLNFGPIARIAQSSFGTPYVLVAHGVDAWEIRSSSRIEALRKANLVLSVSRYTRDRLIQEAGLDAHRVKILPNTYDPDMFAIAPKPPRLLQKYGLRPETPVILTVGRLADDERYKGYDQIIKALPEIRRAIPDARYLLVGKGSDRPRIERLIAEVGVQDAVILAGFVRDEELAEHYNLCDIFAMPSMGEGFGIVYLEALACGKPVLAGNKDGSRDAVADGELGLLVDPENTPEIAAEIIRVLRREHSHPILFNPESLRRRVVELFGFETFTKTVADLLRPFLDRRPPQIEGELAAEHR